MYRQTDKTIKDEWLITKIINIHASCFSVIYNYAKLFLIHWLKFLVVVTFTSINFFYIGNRVFVLRVIEMSAFYFYWPFCTALIKIKVIIMQQGNEHLIAFVKNFTILKKSPLLCFWNLAMNYHLCIIKIRMFFFKVRHKKIFLLIWWKYPVNLIF